MLGVAALPELGAHCGGQFVVFSRLRLQKVFDLSLNLGTGEVLGSLGPFSPLLASVSSPGSEIGSGLAVTGVGVCRLLSIQVLYSTVG